MRKSPTITTEKICKHCHSPFIPKGNRQFYCSTCIPIMKAERKKQWYASRNPDAYSEKPSKVCSVCGGKFSSSINGVPYCNKHYLRMKTTGKVELNKRKSKNSYIVLNDYVELKTTKNQSFFIDAKDLDVVLKYTWCLSKTGYLVANINHKVVKLHRYILDVDSRQVIDHINGNPLDNRRNNLRICDQSNNGKNLKLKRNNNIGYPGIRKTHSNTYNVRITFNNKEIHIGNFNTLDEAISARKNAEIKYYGEFAPSLGALK